jgi:hypothetical protein
MFVRRTLAVFTALMLGVTLSFHGQDTPSSRGRKYRPPPDVSHIEVMVIKGSNKKPIANAAVIFHPVKDGREEGNLEVKTDPDGQPGDGTGDRGWVCDLCRGLRREGGFAVDPGKDDPSTGADLGVRG